MDPLQPRHSAEGLRNPNTMDREIADRLQRVQIQSPDKHSEAKERAYKALAQPKLEYSSPAWNPYIQRDVKRIQQVQRNAARFATVAYVRLA